MNSYRSVIIQRADSLPNTNPNVYNQIARMMKADATGAVLPPRNAGIHTRAHVLHIVSKTTARVYIFLSGSFASHSPDSSRTHINIHVCRT